MLHFRRRHNNNDSWSRRWGKAGTTSRLWRTASVPHGESCPTDGLSRNGSTAADDAHAAATRLPAAATTRPRADGTVPTPTRARCPTGCRLPAPGTRRLPATTWQPLLDCRRTNEGSPCGILMSIKRGARMRHHETRKLFISGIEHASS